MATDINLGHYTGNPGNNPLDAVRLLIGDTKDPCRYTDAEVEYFLEQAGGDPQRAAQSVVAVSMTAAAAFAGTRTIGKTTITDNRTQAYKDGLAALQNTNPVGGTGQAVQLFDVEGSSPAIFDYGINDNPAASLLGGPHEVVPPENGDF